VTDPAGAVVPSTISTTTGLATVTGLVPGRTYTFTVTATNYEQLTPLEVPIVPGSNPVSIVMTSKPASAAVTIGPAAAATGLALVVTDLSTSTVVPSTLTGLTASVPDLVPGRTYRFAATATNFQKPPVDVTIVPGSNPVPITMDPKPAAASITLSGSVASAPGFELTISPSTGVTGPTGTGPYTFAGLTPDATYTFKIVASGYITYNSAGFSAGPNGTIIETFPPVPFATLTDTVANGTAGDLVYLCAASGDCNAGTHLQVASLTAGSNSFTFSGLNQGSYRARAFRSQGDNDIKAFTVAVNTGVIEPFPLALALKP
jgi:hypothetical protein